MMRSARTGLATRPSADCIEERFVRFLGYPAEIQREVCIERTDVFFGRMRKTLEKKVRRPAADHDDVGAVALQGIHQLQQQGKVMSTSLGSYSAMVSSPTVAGELRQPVPPLVL